MRTSPMSDLHFSIDFLMQSELSYFWILGARKAVLWTNYDLIKNFLQKELQQLTKNA